MRDLLKEAADAAYGIAKEANPEAATFDQLAEEVMELHLSLRGKHEHHPAVEWLEIASIALSALAQYEPPALLAATASWVLKHILPQEAAWEAAQPQEEERNGDGD